MRKIIAIFIVCTSLLLMSCGSTSTKYYKYEEGVKLEENWIEIKGKKWSDSDDLSGTLTINDGTIVFYAEIFGSNEEVLSGTISNGIIKIKSILPNQKDTIYASDGSLPSLNTSYDVLELDEFELNEKTFSIMVNADVNNFNFDACLSISPNAVYELYSDSQKKNIVKDTSTIPLNSNYNTFYLYIIDPNHQIAVKDYIIKINKVVYYTVSFYNEDKTLISNVNVQNGETVKNVPYDSVNTIEGYEVTGWYYLVSNAWGQQIKTNIEDIDNFVINKDMALFPIYTTRTFEISLEGVDEKFSVTYNEHFNLPIMSKGGYIFDGWKTANGEKVTDQNGNSIQPYQYGNETLYQIWIPEKYQLVVFNEGHGSTDIDTFIWAEYQSIVSVQAYPESGYKFIGWYEDGTLLSEEDRYDYTMEIGGITLTAVFDIETYTINYHLDGGVNSINNIHTSYTINSNNIPLYDAQKSFYNFLGWYTDENYYYKITNINQGSTGNIDLYAKFLPVQYSIKYYLNGGENNPNNKGTYSHFEEITIQDPTRNGYTFEGWYKDAYFNEQANTTISKGSIGIYSYYAKWSVNQYNIIYELNDGINHDDNISTFSAIDILTFAEPSKTGYNFDGWYLESDFISKVTSTVNLFDDITLYAKWVPKEYQTELYTDEDGVRYKVYFNVNGGNEAITSQTVTQNNGLVYPEVPKRTGYSFIGWYQNLDDTTVYDFSKPITSDITLHAKWKLGSSTPIHQKIDLYISSITYVAYTEGTLSTKIYNGSTYSVTISDNYGRSVISSYNGDNSMHVVPGESYRISVTYRNTTNPTSTTVYFTVPTIKQGGKSVVTTSTITYNQNYQLAVPTRPFYEFDGWYEMPYGQGKQFTDNSGNSLNIWKEESVTKLYAKWIETSYDINYHLDADEINGDNPTSYGINDILDLKNPTKEYYFFVGWYLNADFSGSKFSGSYPGLSGDLDLYPKFIPLNYQITYNDGGTNQNPASYTVLDEVILTEATKAGYTFAGWYLDDELTNMIETIEVGSSGDLILYAKWDINTYQINYNLNEGTNHEDQKHSYTIIDQIDLLEPTRIGYTFKGWYQDTELTALIESIDVGTYGDLTFYAKWDATIYTIEYVLYKGQNHPHNVFVYTINDEIILEAPTKAGFEFAGWYLDDAFTDQIETIEKNSYGNVTLYAHFIPNQFTITYMDGNDVLEEIKYYTEEEINFPYYSKEAEQYSIEGWYLNSELTLPVDFTNMQANNIILYAKWMPYEIKITTSVVNAVSMNDDLTVDYFKAIALDSDGEKWPVEIFVSATDLSKSVGKAISVIFTATGKYGKTARLDIDNIKVYGMPTITYDDVEMINQLDELTADFLGVTSTDSFNQPLEVIIKSIPLEYKAGDIISIEYIAKDIASNQTIITIDNVKVYGTPEIIRNEEKVNIREDDEINLELFNIQAKDSFDEVITPTLEILNGVQKAGTKMTLRITATEVNGVMIESSFDVFVYGAPVIQEYQVLRASVLDEITAELLGVRAFDSFGNELFEIVLTKDSGEQVGGSHMQYTATVTDELGNTASKQLSDIMIYDTPTIEYDEDITFIKDIDLISATLFKAIAYDSFGKELFVEASLYESEMLSGTYIKVSLETTDILGQKQVVIIENIAVYSANDIEIDYKPSNSNAIKLESIGEEFLVSAVDAFNQPISTKVEIVKGEFNAGEIIDLVLVATDKAGNQKSTDVIRNIRVYGAPTITFINELPYILDDLNIIFNFKAYDSFNQTLAVGIEIIDGKFEAGQHVTIIATVKDTLGNQTQEEYRLFVINSDQVYINLDSNGGIIEKPFSIGEKQQIFNIEVPLKDYYNFIGWFDLSDTQITNEAGELLNAWSDSSYGSLIAKYEPINYEITYLLDGGDDADNPSAYNYEQNFDLKDVSKDGYTFLGWLNVDTNEYTDKISLNSYGNITLKAIWQANTYKLHLYKAQQYQVDFETNGGSTVPSQIINPLSTLKYPPIPTKSNYYFVGWYENSDFSGNPYDFNKPIESSFKLYAKYNYTGYPLIVNDTAFTFNPGSNYVHYALNDGTAILKSDKYYPSFNINIYNHQTGVSVSSKTYYGTSINHAFEVQANTLYRISIIAASNTCVLNSPTPDDGGKISFESRDVVFDQSFELPVYSAEYHTFYGWYDTDGNKYTNNLGQSLNVFKVPNDVILYPKFELTPYNITYVLNDGYNNVSNPIFHKYGQIVDLYNPTRFGYTFLGWYTTADFSEQIFSISADYAEDITIYAKWEANSYRAVLGGYSKLSITFNLYDGSKIVKYVDNGTQLDSIPTDSRSGYTFAGWVNSATNEYFNFNEFIANDVELSPRFVSNNVHTTTTTKRILVGNGTTGYMNIAPLSSGVVSFYLAEYSYNNIGFKYTVRDRDTYSIVLEFEVTEYNQYMTFNAIGGKNYSIEITSKGLMNYNYQYTVILPEAPISNLIVSPNRIKYILFDDYYVLPVPEAIPGKVFVGWVNSFNELMTDSNGNSLQPWKTQGEIIFYQKWQ